MRVACFALGRMYVVYVTSFGRAFGYVHSSVPNQNAWPDALFDRNGKSESAAHCERLSRRCAGAKAVHYIHTLKKV